MSRRKLRPRLLLSGWTAPYRSGLPLHGLHGTVRGLRRSFARAMRVTDAGRCLPIGRPMVNGRGGLRIDAWGWDPEPVRVCRGKRT